MLRGVLILARQRHEAQPGRVHCSVAPLGTAGSLLYAALPLTCPSRVCHGLVPGLRVWLCPRMRYLRAGQMCPAPVPTMC